MHSTRYCPELFDPKTTTCLSSIEIILTVSKVLQYFETYDSIATWSSCIESTPSSSLSNSMNTSFSSATFTKSIFFLARSQNQNFHGNLWEFFWQVLQNQYFSGKVRSKHNVEPTLSFLEHQKQLWRFEKISTIITSNRSLEGPPD